MYLRIQETKYIILAKRSYRSDREDFQMIDQWYHVIEPYTNN